MGKINKRLKYYMRNYKLITCLGLLMLVCMFTGIQIHAEDTVETAVENTVALFLICVSEIPTVYASVMQSG